MTVYNMSQKYKQIGTVTTQQKSSQSTKPTEHARRQLSCIITRCQQLTVAQVTSLMTSHNSTRNSQAHRHWTINEWAKVILTD
ncbi:hypothetical protein O181_112860 [Austropuccinia psidii MF-1]|uniref:Uncharacterized protein n=1 Tax=Austropuccinia psidii MF-1 TaxID=1389203 RepID=A0A9Q3K589_9BASI|nr:hypothetical protein [Austropuccinia psidii MF-1]